MHSEVGSSDIIYSPFIDSDKMVTGYRVISNYGSHTEVCLDYGETGEKDPLGLVRKLIALYRTSLKG